MNPRDVAFWWNLDDLTLVHGLMISTIMSLFVSGSLLHLSDPGDIASFFIRWKEFLQSTGPWRPLVKHTRGPLTARVFTCRDLSATLLTIGVPVQWTISDFSATVELVVRVGIWLFSDNPGFCLCGLVGDWRWRRGLRGRRSWRWCGGCRGGNWCSTWCG
jgi:hypothetical protein